ncbi:uncharacterized protein LOC119615842 [Lucilia sericata]|uniref:uncharacterized protein LOC119615842 n=1 Tax=Lucilia sericata TaxID=13632 RepID=UPI0018A7F00B|nr:uncharacterized protein LOC119615842 [Lucilia sericata]XP_037827757.1 uncharacterized protein LOC119615842 [Lucilia sericata]
MLSLCWRNTTANMQRFDLVSRQSMGQFLRYTNPKYHVQHQHHQQTLRKHTQAETIVDDNTTSATQQYCSKSNNMKTSTSSVFSSYTKEESYQKMQLKHLQQPSHTSEMPVAAASAAATTSTTATKPVHIPYNIDWVFERLKNPNGLWFICSQIAIFTVGLFSKIVLGE